MHCLGCRDVEFAWQLLIECFPFWTCTLRWFNRDESSFVNQHLKTQPFSTGPANVHALCLHTALPSLVFCPSHKSNTAVKGIKVTRTGGKWQLWQPCVLRGQHPGGRRAGTTLTASRTDLMKKIQGSPLQSGLECQGVLHSLLQGILHPHWQGLLSIHSSLRKCLAFLARVLEWASFKRISLFLMLFF